MDFYVAVDLNGFIELVNAIDGIDFEVPINMNYDDPAQNLHIHFSAGQQHLDGEEAMEVVALPPQQRTAAAILCRIWTASRPSRHF